MRHTQAWEICDRQRRTNLLSNGDSQLHHIEYPLANKQSRPLEIILIAEFVEVREILTATLQLGNRGKLLQRDTNLLVSVPEIDSMSIVAVLTALEEHYGIEIADDEISEDSLRTIDGITELVNKTIRSCRA